MGIIRNDSGYIFRINISAYTTLITFAASLVFLRLFVKIRIVRNIGADDYAILFALVGLSHKPMLK